MLSQGFGSSELLKMKRIIIFLNVFIIAFSRVSMKSLNADYYSSIIRTNLNSVNLISLYPQGWLTKAIKSTSITGKQYHQGSQVREIIFIPSLFTLRECDEYSSAVDDEHFCSKLCEKGFIVHILDPVRKAKFDYAINAQFDWNYLLFAVKEVVQWRTKTVQNLPGRSIALIASEMSVGALLNYMSEVALPMSPTRVDIGAIVVVDPVPINYLHSASCRRVILDKYVAPLSDALRRQKAAAAAVKKKKATLKTVFATNTSATMENIQNIKFLDRIKMKGPMGEYLIRLADSALEPKGEVMLTQDFNLVMRNAHDTTMTLEEEINYYEAAISTNDRKSIGRSGGQKPLYSALDGEGGGGADDAVTDKAILGSFPSRSSEVALVMKDRMLVLSCEDYCDDESLPVPLLWDDHLDLGLDGTAGGSSGGRSVWDSRAVEELAQLYQATPVIQLPSATDTTREDSDDDEDDGDDEGADGSQDSSSADDTGWTKEDKGRHRKLAQAIADWLHMLTAFNYL